MIGPHLFKRHPERRAARHRSRSLPTSSRWNAPEPMRLGVGFLLLGLGGLLGLGYLLEVLFGERGDAALALLFAIALLFLGSAWLLFAVGQQIASRLRGTKKRCGSCHFFEVPSGLYVIGRCQADPSRRMVSHTDSCSAFCFSERAMVRDRLGQHPGMLKQLQIIGSRDVNNRSE